MTVAIVDLDCANLASVRFALDRAGARYCITKDADVIESADKVILPGVGSSSYAAERIDALELRETLFELKQPLLGLCLGMQLFFDRSEEGNAKGLGLCRGAVAKLVTPPGEPWPHMGWSGLAIKNRESRLLHGIDDGAFVYFVHGYFCPVTDETAAIATYGTDFAAVVETERLFGCQFHPERSGEIGARIIENFLDAPC